MSEIPNSEEMFGCADFGNKNDIRDRKDRIDEEIDLID